MHDNQNLCECAQELYEQFQRRIIEFSFPRHPVNKHREIDHNKKHPELSQTKIIVRKIFSISQRLEQINDGESEEFECLQRYREIEKEQQLNEYFRQDPRQGRIENYKTVMTAYESSYHRLQVETDKNSRARQDSMSKTLSINTVEIEPKTRMTELYQNYYQKKLINYDKNGVRLQLKRKQNKHSIKNSQTTFKKILNTFGNPNYRK